MFRNILVPLDGSRFSEHALPLAISIAKRAGADLHLLKVFSPLTLVAAENPMVFDDAMNLELKTQDKNYLDRIVERVKQSGASTVLPTLLEGEVTESIRSMISGTSTDLVVMSTHGRGPMGRFWLGSVADELIRESTAPMLLQRPTEDPVDLKQDVEFKHIVVPLDGTPHGEQILKTVTALGALFQADYKLLRVVTPILPWDYQIEGTGYSQMASAMLDQINRLQGEVEREASRYLDTVADKLRADKHSVSTKVVAADQPASAILSESTPPEIDLVAIETHGRKGLARLFLGSVADKVIRGASTPVLVHKPV